MKHLLYMLWTGNGLWGWLLPWLPVLFQCVIGWFVLRLVYRIYWAPPSPRGVPVRGSRLVSFGWIGLRKLLSPDKQRLRIGGVALPRELEPLHLLVSGSTGAGKSQTIQGTLGTLRARGDAAIITDIGSEALRGFGQTDDWIMNPLDARSVAWSPFAEMDGPADAERLAKSMIPDHEGIEREWFVYSQALVAAALKRLWERGAATNESLLHALTLASPAELKLLVQGLPAQALFHEGAEKMLASVRGIIGSYFAPYSYLPKEAGPNSWSIRRYVREGQGWLWLSYREDQAAALRPLLAAWIGEAVNAKLSLSAERVRRHWLLLDEVASLGRVQGLSDALTKGRKYGLCAIVGLQSVAQLRDAHGGDGAQTLLSCLSSQLLLRANDPETAEYASRHLGESEVLRESISQGQHRTVTQQHQVERLVLASQIQGLPNRVGYLRLAGQDSVRRVHIPLIQRAAHLEAFVPRKPAAEVSALPTVPSVHRVVLDADAILGRAQITGNEK
ncbi:MAG: type IV secretion system DNA-binding domain-containing protein [Steroidobacteraceae bacterium]